MTLKQVFEDMSDGIVVVNQDGDISYFNKAASKLISGDTIDNLGLAAFQRMMRLILEGELSTPVKFVEKVLAGTEYSVKIITMNSFFVVQFVEVEFPNDYQQIKANAIRMIHDRLGKKLDLLMSNLEMIKNYHLRKGMAAPESLISNNIDLIQDLSISASELDHLADLYLKQPIDSYSIIAPVKLLKSALAQVEASCFKKDIKVKIRKNRTSPVKFYCNAPWMKMAVTECLIKLIQQAERNSVIFIKMDLHGHFLTIIIEQSAEDISPGGMDSDTEWIEQKFGASLSNRQVKDSVSFDF